MVPKETYDVAIIGAGIGGLTAACLLCKAGLKVALIEKEPHAGGYLAGYQRKGFRFDTAIHWLNQCSEKGVVTKIFKLIGKDYPVCKIQKNIRRYKGDNINFLLTNEPDKLRDELIAFYPQEKKGITRFFKASRKLGESLSNFGEILRSTETMSFVEKLKHNIGMLRFALPFIPYIGYKDKKMEKGLQKFFKDKRLHRLFSSETDLLSCMVPVGWAYYEDYQHPPQGGGQVIPEWMRHVLKHHGCDIFFNATVKTINVDGNTATGLAINTKGKDWQLNARSIIAACDLQTVYQSMLPASGLTKRMLKKLNEAEIYASSFTISIALDCEAEDLGFGGEMVHLFKEDICKKLSNSGDAAHSALTILAPSVHDKSLAPKGCGTLVIFMPAYMDQHNQWATGEVLERGDSYNLLKKEIAEELISRVANSLVPDLRDHIIFYDVATPVTHWRYTGNMAGSMMGTKPGKQNIKSGVSGYATPFKNMFIGGQWAELGGGVPIAAKAGTNAALLVLKRLRPEAFKILIDYFDGAMTTEAVNDNLLFRSYSSNWERKQTSSEKYFSGKAAD